MVVAVVVVAAVVVVLVAVATATTVATAQGGASPPSTTAAVQSSRKTHRTAWAEVRAGGGADPNPQVFFTPLGHETVFVTSSEARKTPLPDVDGGGSRPQPQGSPGSPHPGQCHFRLLSGPGFDGDVNFTRGWIHDLTKGGGRPQSMHGLNMFTPKGHCALGERGKNNFVTSQRAGPPTPRPLDLPLQTLLRRCSSAGMWLRRGAAGVPRTVRPSRRRAPELLSRNWLGKATRRVSSPWQRDATRRTAPPDSLDPPEAVFVLSFAVHLEKQAFLPFGITGSGVDSGSRSCIQKFKFDVEKWDSKKACAQGGTLGTLHLDIEFSPEKNKS